MFGLVGALLERPIQPRATPSVALELGSAPPQPVLAPLPGPVDAVATPQVRGCGPGDLPEDLPADPPDCPQATRPAGR